MILAGVFVAALNAALWAINEHRGLWWLAGINAACFGGAATAVAFNVWERVQERRVRRLYGMYRSSTDRGWPPMVRPLPPPPPAPKRRNGEGR